MSENVKKIRELEDFNVNTEISRDDLLIVATGPDTRRDSEGNADPISPQTVKTTIEAIITAYNKSLIPPSGGGSTTDPSDRPNAEVPKPGGGTYFQDTTPFTAANLDVMIKSGCGIEVVEECHNASEVSVDCSSADLKYKTKKLCLSNIPSSALNLTSGSIPLSALDTTSGTIPASAVDTSPGSVDPAALSLDAGDDFEIDSDGNLKLKDGVAQPPSGGGGGSSGGISNPPNDNLVASGYNGTVDTTFDITTKGGSASDVWGVFAVNNGGGNHPNHQVWTSHDSSFSAPNLVARNQSSKDQTNTFQFVAPVDSSGKCYIRNIETVSNHWQVFYMGSIGAGGGGGTDGLTSDSGAVHIVKDVHDAYTDLNIRNTAETGRGAIVKMGVNSTGSPQADKVSEQLSVQIQGSNSGNGPRGALTYENFNALALPTGSGNVGAVSNLFIDGGRISGYSSFDLPSHVENNGEMTLGKASVPWKQIWLNEVQATPSDERKKQDILDIDEAERAVAVKAKALLKKFRYKEAFKQKGEGARIHFGIIAQELIEAFESEGLDPMKYSMICYDEWWRNPEDFTDVKEEETEGYTHEDRYSIRYSELLAFIIAAI